MASPTRSLRSRKPTDNTPRSNKKSSKALRLEILSTFQCPLHDDPLALISQVTKSRCPFGHKGKRGEILREVSSYFCVDSLLGNCSENVSILLGATDLNGQLVKCENGIHPNLEDLLDDDFLMKKMASVILNIPNSNSVTLNLKRTRDDSIEPTSHNCVICLNMIVDTPFGLLENCVHSFCVDCILKWYEMPEGKRSCPTCKVNSSRVIIAPYFTDSKPEKKRLYEFCRRSVDIGRSADEAVGRKNRSTIRGARRNLTLDVERVASLPVENPQANATIEVIDVEADEVINEVVDAEAEVIDELNNNRRRSYCYIM